MILPILLWRLNFQYLFFGKLGCISIIPALGFANKIERNKLEKRSFCMEDVLVLDDLENKSDFSILPTGDFKML